MSNNEYLKDPSYSALLSLDYGISSGSGFRLKYKDSLYLVTAKHVLFAADNSKRCTKLVVTSQNSRGNENDSRIVEIDIAAAQIFHSLTDDVAVLLLEKNDISENCLNVIQEGNLKLSHIESEMTRGISDIGIANEKYSKFWRIYICKRQSVYGG